MSAPWRTVFMSKLHPYLSVSFLLLLTSAAALAQEDTTAAGERIARICADSAGAGALVGRLTHADSGEPLGQVRIRVAWSDSAGGGASRTDSRLVRTDDGGRFTVCGIPPASRVQALVGTGRYGRRTEVFRMPGDGFLSREFTYVLPDAPMPDAGADTAHAAEVPEPDSARYVLPPLEVPIPPETVLEGFRRRRESRKGHFFTRNEIMETDPTWLSDVFRQRGIFEVSVEFDPDVSPGPYRIRLFDPDSGWRTWCRPNLVVNGRPVPRLWSLNDFLPEEVAAVEVYWNRNETPFSFRQGVSPDLARLGAGTPAFRGGEAEGPPTSRPVSDDFFRDCGTILLWTRSAVDSTG